MKTVIFVLAAIVAVNAQTTCVNTPPYKEKIDPVVCPRAGIQLPNYENAQTYYDCLTLGGNGTLTNCASGNFFSYVKQLCAPCATYTPSAECSTLPFKPTCVPIGSSTPGVSTASTAAPSTAGSTTPSGVTNTTAAATTATTKASTAAPSTTPGVPEPPTEPGTGTTSAGDTPSGTTIFVPQPPSPGESNVPTPVTPVPTAPIIDPTPPTAAEPK